MRRLNGILIICCLGTAVEAGAGRQDFASPQVEPSRVKLVSVVEDPPAAADDLAALQNVLLRLKAEREALQIEETIAKQQLPLQPGPEAQELAQMRRRMAELVNKLAALNAAKKSGDQPGPFLMPLPGSTEKGKQSGTGKQKQSVGDRGDGKSNPDENLDVGMPADPRTLAAVLFKAGNFEFALKAYRTLNMAGMKPDKRAPVQYLMATCLRKMGKIEEAAGLYREVANMRGDEQVAACAQWQLVHLRWRAEFEAQLKELRERGRALEGPS